MLKPVFISARDIPDAWYQLVRAAVEQGREYTVTKGSTPTKRWELDFASAQITHPGARPLEPDILAGIGIPNPVEPGYAEHYLPYYMTDLAQPGEHYTYGQDLAWQIEWVIDYYKRHGPGTKHCYMTVGRPESLRFYDESVDYAERIQVRDRAAGTVIQDRTIANAFNLREPGTTQCLRGVDTAIKYGKLHFSIHFRSWNLWNGLPANLACLQLVKEYMAQEIGVEDGEMFITCLKLGLAEAYFDLARLRLYLQQGRGECATVCPQGVFAVNAGKAALLDRDGCMECGACAKNCPVGAIQVNPGVGCAAYIISGWIKGRENATRGCDAECC